MTNIKILFYILAVALVSCDFYSRFLEDEYTKSTVAISKNGKALLPIRVSPKQALETLYAYEKLDPLGKQGNLPRDNKMSLQQQMLQQGELNELHAGDLVISLKAVIDNKGIKAQLFALLQVKNITDNTSQIVKLIGGQNYKGYSVAELTLGSLTFTSINENTRHITLPLYSTSVAVVDKNNIAGIKQ